ncbi:Zinc finger protein CONSTANS-LIKE 13 [Hordeum vulgare]|nr:Zinc finger protein CONSTANS-LIKE 13 [Hordeum vulgare]
MVREDREAREHLEAKTAHEAYMQKLRRQHPELVDVERMIFADAEGGEFIVLCFDDNVDGGEDVGEWASRCVARMRSTTFDEWRSVFPNDPNDAPAQT